jgi:hypothetical protein
MEGCGYGTSPCNQADLRRADLADAHNLTKTKLTGAP